MQDAAENSRRQRTVRSFVRRAGRITPAQKRALQTLWPAYGIDYQPGELKLDEVFGRKAQRIILLESKCMSQALDIACSLSRARI
jgi:tRNA G46 methylase TrmB